MRVRDRWQYNESLLRELVSRHTSMVAILGEIGLRAAGGNYASLRAACERFGLSCPKGEPDRAAANSRRALPDELLFVEHGASRSAIRNRMLKRPLEFPYVCAECDLGSEWNGKRLSLQVNHKNGVYNDHRKENLEWLCPNCHSQTPEYAGGSHHKYVYTGPKAKREPKHGTTYCYSKGCRCDLCRAANTAHTRAYRESRR